MDSCVNCALPKARKSYTYCSNKCQGEFQYKKYIEKWKLGEANGGRGISAKAVSRHVRKYLLEKYAYICSACSWGEKHPISGEIPLEIDHIDGDSENNAEENLRLLCPNCHSLTPNFRNLNRGMGREWRRLKYMKNS